MRTRQPAKSAVIAKTEVHVGQTPDETKTANDGRHGRERSAAPLLRTILGLETTAKSMKAVRPVSKRSTWTNEMIAVITGVRAQTRPDHWPVRQRPPRSVSTRLRTRPLMSHAEKILERRLLDCALECVAGNTRQSCGSVELVLEHGGTMLRSGPES